MMRTALACTLLALAALWQFVHASPPGATAEWRSDLGSPEPEIRRRAALRLGAARDVASVDALVAALRDPDPMARELVVWALGRAGDRRAVPALVALAGESLAEEGGELPVHLVPALGALADPASIPLLRQVAGDASNPGDREAALVALARIGTPEAAAVLDGAFVREEDEHLRALVLRQRAALGPVPDRMLEAGAHDPSPVVQRAAAEILAAGLAEKSRSARANTPEAAGPADPEEPSPDTLDIDLEDPALAGLGDFHPIERGPLLLGAPPDVPRLLEALAHGQPEDRCNAALVLGTMLELPPEGRAALRRAAQEDPDDCARWTALKALGMQGDAAFAEGMYRLLEDTDEEVRLDAVSALERLGPGMGDDSAPLRRALRRALADEAPPVRVAAARAMARLFPDEPEELWGVLEDDDPEVRQQVQEVLDQEAL